MSASGKDLRIALIVHEAINVVAVKMGEEDRVDRLGVKARRCHALQQPAVPLTINRMTARAGIDQHHLIAQLERHDDKQQGRLIVGKTGTAQRGLDLFDAAFLTMPSRSGTSRMPSIREKTSMSPTLYLRKGCVTDC